jgi:PAS domain-containing protein
MLQPHLQSRLNYLFSYINDGIPTSSFSNLKKVYGWVWECDAHGNYSFCSSEVSDALGLNPDDFLGQPLTEFALHKSSAKILERALHSRRCPLEVELEYQTPDQRSKQIKLYVMRIPTTNGHQPSWRGFAQVLD